MANRIGDVVFTRAGQPAILRDRSAVTGSQTVDRDLGALRELHPFGFVNGLNEQTRQRFNSIMAETKKLGDVHEQVEVLRDIVQDLDEDPSNENRSLANYLRSEQAHLMFTHNISPTVFVQKSGFE